MNVLYRFRVEKKTKKKLLFWPERNNTSYTYPWEVLQIIKLRLANVYIVNHVKFFRFSTHVCTAYKTQNKCVPNFKEKKKIDIKLYFRRIRYILPVIIIYYMITLINSIFNGKRFQNIFNILYIYTKFFNKYSRVNYIQQWKIKTKNLIRILLTEFPLQFE